MRQTTLPSPFGAPQRPAHQQFFTQQQQQSNQQQRQPRGARQQQPTQHTPLPPDLPWPPLDEQLPPVPPEFADANCPQKWMPFSNPNGTNILLFVQGANRARWKSIKGWRKQVLEEGLDDFELSSIPKGMHIPVACQFGPPALLPHQTNPTTSPQFGNSAATSNTAAPTIAAQISKVKSAIQLNSDFGEPTERLEQKLLELQTLANATPINKTTYGKAKQALEAAKAAKAKQVKLVAAKTLELEDEQAKLEELATAMANAKKLADEKFAEEEKETGRQRTTVHLAKLAEGEVPTIDVSTFLELDGTNPEEDERTRTEAQEGFMQWFAPLLAKKKARQDLAKMAIDQANGTDHHPAPDPDLPDPKRRAGEAPAGSEGQTILPGNPAPLVPTDAAPALPAAPPAAAATASGGSTGGSATPLQTTPQKPQHQSEAARKAAERKQKLDALEAKIEAESCDAAVARAVAVNKAIAEQAADADSDQMDADLFG